VIELAGVDDVHLRLYRRVIEIRDGMLALRGFLPSTYAPTPATTTTPPSLPYALSPVPTKNGADAYGKEPGVKRARADAYGQAMGEAQAIALALRRRGAGEAPSETPGTWAAVGPEMADEVAWLSLVSDAYRRISPAAVRTPTPFGSAR
jgi:hypothetical protein